jgi:hypothetical protein
MYPHILFLSFVIALIYIDYLSGLEIKINKIKFTKFSGFSLFFSLCLIFGSLFGIFNLKIFWIIYNDPKLFMKFFLFHSMLPVSSTSETESINLIFESTNSNNDQSGSDNNSNNIIEIIEITDINKNFIREFIEINRDNKIECTNELYNQFMNNSHSKIGNIFNYNINPDILQFFNDNIEVISNKDIKKKHLIKCVEKLYILFIEQKQDLINLNYELNDGMVTLELAHNINKHSQILDVFDVNNQFVSTEYQNQVNSLKSHITIQILELEEAYNVNRSNVIARYSRSSSKISSLYNAITNANLFPKNSNNSANNTLAHSSDFIADALDPYNIEDGRDLFYKSKKSTISLHSNYSDKTIKASSSSLHSNNSDKTIKRIK